MPGYHKGSGKSDYKGSYRGGRGAKAALMIVIGGKKKKGDDDDDYGDREDKLADLKKRLKRRRR